MPRANNPVSFDDPTHLEFCAETKTPRACTPDSLLISLSRLSAKRKQNNNKNDAQPSPPPPRILPCWRLSWRWPPPLTLPLPLPSLLQTTAGGREQTTTAGDIAHARGGGRGRSRTRVSGRVRDGLSDRGGPRGGAGARTPGAQELPQQEAGEKGGRRRGGARVKCGGHPGQERPGKNYPFIHLSVYQFIHSSN